MIAKTEEDVDTKVPRWDFLFQLAKEKGQERKQLFQENKERQLNMVDPECTFKPKKVSEIQCESQESFFERQKQWMELKKKKTEEIKVKVDLKRDELKECTFKPQISSSLKGKEEEVKLTEKKGINEFIARQQLAREKQLEKEQLLNNPYAHLSGEKNGHTKKHVLTSQYESKQKAERVSFKKAIPSPQKEAVPPQKEEEQEKIQLGTAMKLLHNELYKIRFTDY